MNCLKKLIDCLKIINDVFKTVKDFCKQFMFSKEHMLINWKPNLKTHFKEWHSDDEAEDDNPLHYSWHWRSSYKLDTDIWAINISKNSVSSVSNYIMTDFINHFGEFEYDWNSFPCNLYVGSVCKILSESIIFVLLLLSTYR